MRVGIDADGGFYDFDKAARDIFMTHSDIPEPITQQQRYHLNRPATSWDGIPSIVGKKNWGWLWQNASSLHLFDRLAPIPGAIEALRELIDEHAVYVITTRPKGVEDQTYRFLGIYNLKPKAVLHSNNKAKDAAALALDVVTDDNPENLKSYLLHVRGSLKGIRVYGVKAPWNQRHGIESSYYRFQWVDGLQDVADDVRVATAA